MSRYRSPLAHFVSNPRDVRNRPKPKPYGLLVHTTGRGILKRARQLGIPPLEAAMEFYTKRGNPFAQYVGDQDGTIIQIADEREQAWHAGIPAAQRRLYKASKKVDNWRNHVSHKALIYWYERWYINWGISNPTELYPTRSPNQCFVGYELIPDRYGRFSPKQYAALSDFISDFWERHKLPDIIRLLPDHPPLRHVRYYSLPEPRCLGHEDVEPLERWNRSGGWDPGSLRAKPKFDWSKL